MEEKIEQYRLLAKGTRGRALVDLVQKATREPGLFAFGEILDVESVKEVGGVTIFKPCRVQGPSSTGVATAFAVAGHRILFLLRSSEAFRARHLEGLRRCAEVAP